MIGGIVIETIILKDRVWVNCAERQSTSKCAIYVVKNEDSKLIRLGDKLWWQGGFAMWTPLNKRFVDRQIPRIGFSGVRRPE